jgi:hypothetical protein
MGKHTPIFIHTRKNKRVVKLLTPRLAHIMLTEIKKGGRIEKTIQ